MKHSVLKTAILTLMVVALAVTGVAAQSTAAASISATIVTPITITKIVDMDFGNAAVQAAAGGTVVLGTNGVRTSTAGVTLPMLSGTVGAAEFNVAGQANYTYAITLPSMVVISDQSNVNNMQVNNFTSNPSVTGRLSAIGTQTIKVGATLNINAGQVAGAYTSGSPFSVTVNYN